jgi:hypothetical protein
MSEEQGPEVPVATATSLFTRDSWFRVSVWAMIGVLLFLSPTFLAVFGWFLDGYSEADDAAAVSHRLHEVVFGMLFTLALVGAISLLLRPKQSTAGLLQLAVTLWTLMVLVNLTVPWQFGLLLQLIPLTAIILLRPRGVRLRAGPLWGWALALTAVALLPFLAEVDGLLGRAMVEAQNHTTHWSAMAAFSLSLILLGVIVAFRITGYRVTGFSISAAAVGYGLVSLAFPFDASSHRFGYSVGLVLWGLGWAGTLRWLDRPRQPQQRPRPVPVLKWILIVPLILVASGAWDANNDEPNVPHRPDPDHPQLVAAEVDRTTCIGCHLTGKAGAPAPPHDPSQTCEDRPCWGGRTDCAGCHQVDPALGGSELRIEVPPGGPTALRSPPEAAIAPLEAEELARLAKLAAG